MTVSIEDLILQTEAVGAPVRLEYVRGELRWEASPALRHQHTIDTIRATIKAAAGSGCGCYHYSDVLIKFGASYKRPDIAIFCLAPPLTDQALEVLPQAVIEIISVGYEEKDVGPTGAPFYLDQGILDVLIFDPRTGQIQHHTAPGTTVHQSPAQFTLRTGCTCEI